jgi:hypothetical protein
MLVSNPFYKFNRTPTTRNMTSPTMLSFSTFF